MKKEDKDTRYYIDLDVKNKTILNIDYGQRYDLEQELEPEHYQRVFVTKGQYNKIIRKYEGNTEYSLEQANIEPENKALFSKPRHKWSKEISQIEFTIKLRGGEGKAIWQTRDKLVLISGAKLATEPQRNKDGSMNFSAQFAEKLRMDYANKVKNGVTTTDIIFKSPNQLGLFLLFGGQNTWAELKDKNGKSLDDWSRVD